MKKLLILVLVFISLIGKINSQTDSIKFEKSQSLLIDGGIQDIQRGSIDKSASGQLGYRGENIFGKFEIRFTAISSSIGIKSDKLSDYSAIILNPYTSKSGLDAFSISYFRRSFTRGGGFVNYLRYLYSKEELSSAEFDKIISDNNAKFNLEKYKHWIYKFGYAIELNVSNFTWTNPNYINKITTVSLKETE